MAPLAPLDLRELSAALAANEIVTLTAPPGTGKTTRIPPALLNAPWLEGRKILILEPRRLAARRAAIYIAEQLGEAPGETVGWHVRLDRCFKKSTRILFLTEGLLARRIVEDPELSDVGLIIFDEFHERSLALDVAFALTREVRDGLRPDLRLLILSATLQRDTLPEARFLEIPAVAYPVETRYLGPVTPASAIHRALREETGSVLCFLPGEGEIRATAEALQELQLPPDVQIAPLYAALDRRDQDQAVAPPSPGRRKVVLATSIAESSLTIEGVRVVVDTGLARVPKYDARNGLTRLMTQRISRDRMTQRAGRAGRLEPGVCYRLWKEGETALQPPAVQPEILDADLTQTALLCAEWGATELPWLTPPPPGAWKRARETLLELGATDPEGRLTDLGQAMARFPVHPAFASMMIRLREIDPAGGALLAAICTEGEKVASLRNLTDFRTVVETVLRERPRAVWQLASQWAGGSPVPRLSVDELIPYLLWAFPGHLARRRDAASGRYLLAAGFGAVLPQGSPFVNFEWLLAVRMSNGEAEAKLHWAAPLTEADLKLCKQTAETRVEWDKTQERIIAAEEIRIGALILTSRPLKTIPPEARLQAERCRLRHRGLPWSAESRLLAARIAFLRKALPEANWPEVSDEMLLEALAQNPKNSLTDLLQAALIESGHSVREVDREAPLRIPVPSGSQIRIDYSGGQPVLAVKIQEVFGLKTSPRIAGGRVPLLLHLLSPAQRPVQITADLTSFWATGYAIVRKDLRGRYPKHYWPEDPTVAIPTRRTTARPTR